MTRHCKLASCGRHLITQRADAEFCDQDCKNAWHNEQRRKQGATSKRLTGASGGVGSRGGNVRSVEEARSLHAEHKAEWTAKVSGHIAATLLATGRFHADDLAPLEIPEEHSAIAGSQTSRFVGKGWMVEVGRRKCQHKAANGRKAGIYEITDRGRKELPQLVGVGAGGGNDSRKERFLETPIMEASADSGEPESLSLLPDEVGRERPLNPLSSAEAA